MSAKAAAWALSPRYKATPEEKLLAVILGDVAGGDSEDEVALNIEYLVSASCMSEDEVRRTLNKMIADEVIANTGRTHHDEPVYKMVRVRVDMEAGHV